MDNLTERYNWYNCNIYVEFIALKAIAIKVNETRVIDSGYSNSNINPTSMRYGKVSYTGSIILDVDSVRRLQRLSATGDLYNRLPCSILIVTDNNDLIRQDRINWVQFTSNGRDIDVEKFRATQEINFTCASVDYNV